jgi:hypothetical protein
LPHAAKDEIRKELIELFLVWVVKCGGEKMPPALQGGVHDEGKALAIFGFEAVVRQCLKGHRYIWCEPNVGFFGVSC